MRQGAVAQELRPGVFAVVFTRFDTAGVRGAGKALTALAYVVEKQAKINVSTGSHRYGTPTPASPGRGDTCSRMNTAPAAMTRSWAAARSPTRTSK